MNDKLNDFQNLKNDVYKLLGVKTTKEVKSMYPNLRLSERYAWRMIYNSVKLKKHQQELVKLVQADLADDFELTMVEKEMKEITETKKLKVLNSDNYSYQDLKYVITTYENHKSIVSFPDLSLSDAEQLSEPFTKLSDCHIYAREFYFKGGWRRRITPASTDT